MERGTMPTVGDSRENSAGMRIFKIPFILQSLVKEVVLKVKVICKDGFIIADGEPVECGAFAFALMELQRLEDEKNLKDKARAEVRIAEMLSNMTFEEIMKREREEEE